MILGPTEHIVIIIITGIASIRHTIRLTTGELGWLLDIEIMIIT